MRYLLWLSIVACVGLYICGPIFDPDLWWHITVGRWILANGEVPSQDYWNLFAAGAPWKAYSWLVELVFAFVSNNFGEVGLLILKYFLAVSLSAVFAISFSLVAKDWFFGSLLGFYSVIASFNNFTLRPQSFVWIYFSLLIALCYLIRREGLNLKKGLALVLLFSLWANTHLTAVLGIFTIICLLFEVGKSKVFFQALILSFLGTLITPYFGSEWLTFFSKASHPVQFSMIAEFTPATIMMYSTGFLIVALVWLLIFAFYRPRSLPVLHYFWAFSFAIAGLIAVKFIPFSVLALLTVVADFWYREKKDRSVLGKLPEGIEKLRKLFNWFPKEGLTFIFIAFCIIFILKTWREPRPYKVNLENAVGFILEKKLPKPIMNGFAHGGYLMYRLSDKQGNLKDKVSIDGRTNVNPPEIWQAYLDTLRGRANWKEYIERVNPKTILWTAESPLNAILKETGSWCRIAQFGSQKSGYVVIITKNFFESNKDKLSDLACL